MMHKAGDGPGRAVHTRVDLGAPARNTGGGRRREQNAMRGRVIVAVVHLCPSDRNHAKCATF